MSFHRLAFFLSFLLSLRMDAWSGGSGLNVVVVINRASTNSVQLGNYYAERRQVPPQNILRIDWTGPVDAWSYADLDSTLRRPLLEMVSARRLTNQAHYVVLSMDIPYRVIQAGAATMSGENSTTSALYYGFKPDYSENSNPFTPSCNLPEVSSNSYAASEQVFAQALPDTAVTNAFLTMMITASDLAGAKAVVDQGVASDGSFPAQTVVLSKSSDPARNVRFYTFDDALFNTRLSGSYSMLRTNSDTPLFFTNLLGYQGGHYSFEIQPRTFVPGAMADSMTSFGGRIFEATGHTPLLAFLAAGASGSYGTVAEPCNYLEKFPSPQAYFYQARGFSLAECYYQSLTNPYQGLLVGEPLAAPFAQPASASWGNLPPGSVLRGITNLQLNASAADTGHPVQQIDLFIDGLFAQTLTTLGPLQGDTLTVRIAGHPVSYAVASPDETIASVAYGLVSMLNDPATTNLTKVRAVLHGDRIALHGIDPGVKASLLPLEVSNSAAPGSAGVHLRADTSGFLDGSANGICSYALAGDPVSGGYLQLTVTKTNGALVSLGVTNSSGTMTLFQMVQQLAGNINSHPALLGPDGLIADDLFDTSPWTPTQTAQFNILARSGGWDAARVGLMLLASAELTATPTGPVSLEQNLTDLQPRAHLYLSAGAGSLAVNFPFDTETQSDGYHQLTAVVYEGTHVKTQRRVWQDVVIRNGSLSATFTTLVGGSNTALEATLQFSIAANTSSIAKIELFSTGGLLRSAMAQQAALFSVPATDLGLGLHPFYALVTSDTGDQYRTETSWIRIIAAETPFRLSMSSPPVTLSWPATAGRSYVVLSTTNPAARFQLGPTITPSNGTGRWVDTNPPGQTRLFRVRTEN